MSIEGLVVLVVVIEIVRHGSEVGRHESDGWPFVFGNLLIPRRRWCGRYNSR